MKQHRILDYVCGMVLMHLPLAATAQYFTVDGIAYNVLSAAEHSVEVTYGNSFYRGDISIPATVNYGGTEYDVVALGEEAFYRSTLTGISIPASVSEIKSSCFLFATLPHTVGIPASVTTIGECAFAAYGLTAIEVDADNPAYCAVDGMLFSKDSTTIVECPIGRSGVVTLPEVTRHIAPCAFIYCQSMTSIGMPQGLESIGYWAFLYNSSLNGVVIPATVTHIDADVFGGCQSLTSLTLDEGNTRYRMDGLMLYSIDVDTLLSCHKSADTVVLPAGLRVVGGFSLNEDVRYVSVPDGVTTIMDNAFNSSGLVAIDLPEAMELIGGYAFSGCMSLERVGMPTTLDAMGEGCFRECIRLAAIEVPDGMYDIPDAAFFMCIGLTDVDMGDGVGSIGAFAFGNCALTEVCLPSTVRTVGQGAFSGDYQARLRRVVFSGQVDTLEQEAFYHQSLEKLLFVNSLPPITDNEYGCLFQANVDTIVVPCGRLGAWLSDSYWGLFADFYYEDCDGIGEIEGDDVRIVVGGDRLTVYGAQSETVCVYDALGRTVYRTACGCEATTVLLPASGAYLVSIGSRPTRKVFTLSTR